MRCQNSDKRYRCRTLLISLMTNSNHIFSKHVSVWQVFGWQNTSRHSDRTNLPMYK